MVSLAAVFGLLVFDSLLVEGTSVFPNGQPPRGWKVEIVKDCFVKEGGDPVGIAWNTNDPGKGSHLFTGNWNEMQMYAINEHPHLVLWDDKGRAVFWSQAEGKNFVLAQDGNTREDPTLPLVELLNSRVEEDVEEEDADNFRLPLLNPRRPLNDFLESRNLPTRLINRVNGWMDAPHNVRVGWTLGECARFGARLTRDCLCEGGRLVGNCFKMRVKLEDSKIFYGGRLPLNWVLEAVQPPAYLADGSHLMLAKSTVDDSVYHFCVAEAGTGNLLAISEHPELIESFDSNGRAIYYNQLDREDPFVFDQAGARTAPYDWLEQPMHSEPIQSYVGVEFPLVLGREGLRHTGRFVRGCYRIGSRCVREGSLMPQIMEGRDAVNEWLDEPLYKAQGDNDEDPENGEPLRWYEDYIQTGMDLTLGCMRLTGRGLRTCFGCMRLTGRGLGSCLRKGLTAYKTGNALRTVMSDDFGVDIHED